MNLTLEASFAQKPGLLLESYEHVKRRAFDGIHPQKGEHNFKVYYLGVSEVRPKPEYYVSLRVFANVMLH